MTDRARAKLKSSIMLALERHQLWGHEVRALILSFDLVHA